MGAYRNTAAALLAALCLGGASAALAHDFFLLPELFVAPRPGEVNVQASVGSSFPSPENVVAANRIDSLAAYGSGEPKLGIAGAGPKALNLRITGARPGTLVTAVTVKPREVDYGEDRIPLIMEEYRMSPEAAGAVERLC